MKITLLSTAYPYRGGIAVFTERLARAFQVEKDDVRISTFSLQNSCDVNLIIILIAYKLTNCK